MAEKIPFLGTGWGFPPTFDKTRASVDMIADENDIHSSLHILLSTEIGERVMQPTYGCNLHAQLFEPLDTTLKTYIKDLVWKATLYHEPRIKVDKLNLVTYPEEGRLDIEIDYTIRSTNSRYNYVYPFYIDEASNIRRQPLLLPWNNT